MADVINSDDLIDFFQIPLPPIGYVVTKDTQFLLGDLISNKVYRGTLSMLMGVLTPTIAPIAVAPVVAFQAPLNGATLTIGVPTFLQVTATDALGIAQVEFFAAGRSLGLGVATGNTYTLAYTTTAGTTINFSAQATNAAGTQANASTFALLIAASTASAKPVVAMLAVDTGHIVGQLIALNATASEVGGTIVKVEFFDGGTLIGLATTTPYSTTYTLTSAGAHYFTAKATDSNGASTVSTVQTTIVGLPPIGNTNLIPTVTFVSATPNPAIAGQSLLLIAQAAELNGAIAQVEFFDGTTSLGVRTTTPYALTILPSLVGQHVYFAKATDSQGATSTDSLTVVVNAAPVVLTVPGAPIIGTAVAGVSTIRVMWAAPSITGGTVITSYEIYLANSTTLVGTTGGNSLFYDDNAAVNGTGRSYQVLAVNAAGRGFKSAPSNVATSVAPVVTPTSWTSTKSYTATCGPGTTGASVPMTSTKTSTVSQADADNLALADATSQANAALVCTAIPSGPTNPSYHGSALTTTPTVAQVQAFVPVESWAFAPRSISFNCNGTYPAFAEPASYGLRVIKDVNLFNVSADITQTVISILVGGVATNYNLYVHNNAQYDPAFILNF